MLKKTVTYTDFDEIERTEDLYFNLTKAELIDMELSAEGGMNNLIEKIIKTQDGKKLVGLFQEIILKAYGEKSEDGKYFMKSDEISDKFKHTQAYSDLYVELVSDDEAASAFINGILPKDFQITDEEIEKARKQIDA